jgi:hypothetical protein
MPGWVWPWVVGTGAPRRRNGVAIDAMIHRDPAIYRRGAGVQATIRPAVGRGVRGAVVSVSW